MSRRITRQPPKRVPRPRPDPDAPIPAPQALVGETTRGAGAQWDAEDDEEHLLAIIQMRLRGASTPRIVRAMRQEYGVGGERTQLLLRRGLERLAKTLDEDHPFARAEAIARLRQDLAELHTPRKDSKGRLLKKDWTAIVAVQRLLADVEGTREPVEVKVDVVHREAAAQVVMALTEEQRAELLERARERKRLADAARDLDLLPAPRQHLG